MVFFVWVKFCFVGMATERGYIFPQEYYYYYDNIIRNILNFYRDIILLSVPDRAYVLRLKN